MSGLASIPTTRPAGPTSRASSHASRPGPQPTSSPRSPGRAPSAARVRARCSTISGAAYAFSRRRTSPGPKRGDAMRAENHTTAAAARAAAPSAREPEKVERVVAEDLPLELRRQATVPGPPPLLGLRPLVDGVEAGVVGIDALDGEVELEPAQAQVVQRLAGHPHEVWIVGVEGAERDRPAQARADPGQPLVQRARHPRLVGVA